MLAAEHSAVRAGVGTTGSISARPETEELTEKRVTSCAVQWI